MSSESVNIRTTNWQTLQSVVVHLSCFTLLLMTVARLSTLTAGEQKLLRERQSRTTLVPSVGSLTGIDAGGATVSPVPLAGDRLVMFVVRANQLPADLAYWNAVVEQSGQGHGSIEYWGVCDAGASCSASQPQARFRIISFLDAFQMRSLVNARSRGDVLQYGKGQALGGHLRLAPDAAAMAAQIRKEAK